MEPLFKLSLLLSLTGIIFLLLLSNLLEPEPISIEKINERMLNQKIQIQGQITNIRTFDNYDFQIISIRDNTGEIDVILNNRVNAEKNQTITIIGRVSEYKGDIEIQADKIYLTGS